MPKKRNRTSPFWNAECSQAIADRLVAEKTMVKVPSRDNIQTYKQCKAKVQYVIRKSKVVYWDKYCNGIDKDTKIGSIWKKIKSLNGSNAKNLIKVPLLDTTKDDERANIIATEFQNASSNNSLPSCFLRQRNDIVSTT